jgi:hypothetical protein
MPVLEAPACGARVVTSDLPELHEGGGSDTIYVKPTESGICEGILRALSSSSAADLDWREQSWSTSAAELPLVLTGQQQRHRDFSGESQFVKSFSSAPVADSRD